jgi:hypothetical protein
MVKRLQNCLHGYETTKKYWIVTFGTVFYGSRITFIDYNPNVISVSILKQCYIQKYSICKRVQDILKTEQP